MTTLNSFKSLISKLSREELKSFLKFLKYYQETDEKKSKAILLVKILIQDPSCSQKDLQVELYGKENYHAFNKLLNRTKEKLYEILLFDKNISKPIYSDRNRVIFEVRKKLLQSEILYLRGMTAELENFHNKIIAKANQYEVYDSLIIALQAKQRFLGFRKGKKGFKKVEMEIKLNEEKRNALTKGRSLFTEITSIINESTNPNEYQSELIKAINILEHDWKLTNSASIRFYLLFLQIEYMQNYYRYDEAENYLNELLRLVINSPSVYTHSRHADVLINLATNEIYLRKYTDAFANAELSKKYYGTNQVQNSIVDDIKFYCKYYSNDFHEAESIIENNYFNSRNSNIPFLVSKRAYLFACIKTLKGDIKMSNELLDDMKEIEKDKEGWNLHKRILTIINRIELKDFESADLKVQSLEKFIKRILKFRNVRKRDVIILRILVKLLNEGFDFDKVYHQRKKYFDLLESDDPDYRWKIKSPEMIIFTKWFQGKMSKNKIPNELVLQSNS